MPRRQTRLAAVPASAVRNIIGLAQSVRTGGSITVGNASHCTSLSCDPGRKPLLHRHPVRPFVGSRLSVRQSGRDGTARQAVTLKQVQPLAMPIIVVTIVTFQVRKPRDLRLPLVMVMPLLVSGRCRLLPVGKYSRAPAGCSRRDTPERTSSAICWRPQPHPAVHGLWTWSFAAIFPIMVVVVRAEPGQRIALESMMQLYTHDFSTRWAGQRRGEVDEHGLFPPYPLDPYWSSLGHIPYLLRAGNHIAGFALLDRAGKTGADVDWNMAEFFVLRKHRRSGVGADAARQIFTMHQGRWEVAVARGNAPALQFWKRAIAGVASITELTEQDVSNELWDGPVFRFRTI